MIANICSAKCTKGTGRLQNQASKPDTSAHHAWSFAAAVCNKLDEVPWPRSTEATCFYVQATAKNKSENFFGADSLESAPRLSRECVSNTQNLPVPGSLRETMYGRLCYVHSAFILHTIIINRSIARWSTVKKGVLRKNNKVATICKLNTALLILSNRLMPTLNHLLSHFRFIHEFHHHFHSFFFVIRDPAAFATRARAVKRARLGEERICRSN